MIKIYQMKIKMVKQNNMDKNLQRINNKTNKMLKFEFVREMIHLNIQINIHKIKNNLDIISKILIM